MAVGVAPPPCVDLLEETDAGAIAAREVVEIRLLHRRHYAGHEYLPSSTHLLPHRQDRVRVLDLRRIHPLVLRSQRPARDRIRELGDRVPDSREYVPEAVALFGLLKFLGLEDL